MMTARTTVAAAAALFAIGVTTQASQNLPQSVVVVHSPKMPGVSPPVVERHTPPRYPPRAMRDDVHGYVSMDVTVGADGHVQDVMLTQSVDEDLDKAAMEAAAQWFFRPGTLNGVAVPVRTNVTIAFQTR